MARSVRVLAILLMAATAALGAGVSSAAAAARPPADHWTFDEGSGTTAADSASPGHPLTLVGGAGWGPGVVGPHALSLDGSHQQYAQSDGPVLDTTHSFTVSAWVKPGTTDGFQTYVSQDGSQISGFFLQLRGDSHRFSFTAPAYDSTKAYTAIAVASDVVPQPGEWYHLAGVYDARRDTISLYVNGHRADTVSRVPSWSADGAFAVGRGFYAAGDTDDTTGEIDDVRAYASALSGAQVAALAGPGRLTVDAAQRGPATNPTQFGEFLEDINHSTDGGLYAELVRNRDLKEGATTPTAWSAVGSGVTVSLDRSDPLTSANPVSLRVSAPAGATGAAGAANDGYWGVPVKPSTTYRVSLYARSDAAGTGPLTVALRSDSGRVWASRTVAAPDGDWTHYSTTLRTPAGIPASEENRIVVTTAASRIAGKSLWLALPSVFPPTYDNAANGFQVDIMRKLAALRPGFFRVPGGNYLEGDTVDTRFAWKQTIGPIEDRPGHFNSAWGYWSQDGMGLLEYLELAEQVHAQPVLAVYAGYNLNGSHISQDQLKPFVDEAVDEIEYATGATTTKWGHKRALDGHPQPFDVHMVEIGNEDFFDGSGSYNAYRYPAFYDALHAADPQLKFVATTPVTSRPYDVIDEHFYSDDPSSFASMAHQYDTRARAGAPKVLVGEYGTTDASPTGDLAAALGEAAFLTGTIRNADLVLGASYAPLLVNVNAPSWPTNLIGYDALHSYGSPSYYGQKMLAAGLGDRVIGTSVVGGTGTLFDVATESPGHTYLDVVNDGDRPAATELSLAGLGAGARGATATTLTGRPAAQNSLAHPRAVAPSTRSVALRGTSLRYRFPADSVTVLDLSTASATGAARRPYAHPVRERRFRFDVRPGDPRLPHRGRRVRVRR